MRSFIYSSLALVTVLLGFSLLDRQPVHASQELIVIDGDFDEWLADSAGFIICRQDDEGATDTVIPQQFIRDDNGVILDVEWYYHDINRDCLASNQADRLYLMHAFYREFRTPVNWDLYDYQNGCTFLDVYPDQNRPDRKDEESPTRYAACMRHFYRYCERSGCQDIESLEMKLYRCGQLGVEGCVDPVLIKDYPERDYASAFDDQMTFLVWRGGQLISFFDFQTEMAIDFADIGADIYSTVCYDTAAYEFDSITTPKDFIRESTGSSCINLNGEPTAVELSSTEAELLLDQSTVLTIAAGLGLLLVLTVRLRRAERAPIRP